MKKLEKPNPNLDWLKAVYPKMLTINGYGKTVIRLNMGREELEAIATDLLRLADENKALFKAAYDIYLRYPGFGQGLNDEDEYLSDNLTNVVEKYNRDHRVITPASAKKAAR